MPEIDALDEERLDAGFAFQRLKLLEGTWEGVAGSGEDYPTHIRLMGAIAVFASMTNIVGGFLVTQRMLKMFKKRQK